MKSVNLYMGDGLEMAGHLAVTLGKMLHIYC